MKADKKLIEISKKNFHLVTKKEGVCLLSKKMVFHFVNTSVLSGLESMVINIATLVDGYDHYYVSPSGIIDDFLKKQNIPHIVVNKLSISSVYSVLKKYRPDIVQGHDVIASICLAANGVYCRRKNIKIVSELHSNDPRMLRPGLRAVLYLIASIAFQRIVVVSDSILKEYVFRKAIGKKTVAIKNVVNPNKIQLQLKKTKSSKKWDLIFLGRFVNEKRPQKFIDIVSNLQKKQNVTAVMVGQGELQDVVAKTIDERHLRSFVDVVGFKPNPYEYLNAAKVLVIPSEYEGFGLVALEALLLGTPVIAEHVGGLVDIVSEECGGFANSIDEYAEKILNIINSADYQQISVAAQKRGVEINNTEKFIDSFKEIYK